LSVQPELVLTDTEVAEFTAQLHCGTVGAPISLELFGYDFTLQMGSDRNGTSSDSLLSSQQSLFAPDQGYRGRTQIAHARAVGSEASGDKPARLEL
jgi:hypothetical protein